MSLANTRFYAMTLKIKILNKSFAAKDAKGAKKKQIKMTNKTSSR